MVSSVIRTILVVGVAVSSVLGFSLNMMSSPQLRAVLWDVDGTLADSYLLGYESTNAVFRNNGLAEIAEDVYHMGTRFTTPRRLAWHSTGDPDDKSGIALGDQFDELYVKLVTMETAPFFPGMSEVLASLVTEHPTLRLGALSNACGAYVTAVLKVNGFTEDFVIGLGADEVPAAKPHPDGLLMICRTLDLHPSQCVYIGDSPSDGQAATNCGMPSVGVTWGSHPVETVKPAFTHMVTSMDALRTTLLEILGTPVLSSQE